MREKLPYNPDCYALDPLGVGPYATQEDPGYNEDEYDDPPDEEDDDAEKLFEPTDSLGWYREGPERGDNEEREVDWSSYDSTPNGS